MIVQVLAGSVTSPVDSTPERRASQLVEREALERMTRSG
jgi:hypothetical protein